MRMRTRIFLFILVSICVLAPTPAHAQEPRQSVPARQPVSSPPLNGVDTDTIVSMQKELKRVGCYVGPLDGVWRREAREALREFGRSVRLEIDADKPDAVTLLIVEGHTSQVCCPPGQHRNATGQCQGQAVAAVPSPAPVQTAPSRSSPTAKDRGRRTAEGPQARETPRRGEGRKAAKPIGPKRTAERRERTKAVAPNRTLERREAARIARPRPIAAARDRARMVAQRPPPRVGGVGDVLAGGL
jgi:hypothetical protein